MMFFVGVLGIILIISGGTNIWLLFSARKWLRLYESVLKKKTDRITELESDYEALDQGMDEQREAYEQEFLSLTEKVNELLVTRRSLNDNIHELEVEKEVMRNHIANLEADIIRLGGTNLPDLEQMRLAALRAEGLHE